MSTARNEAGTAIGEETISRRAAYVPEGLRTGPSVNDRSFLSLIHISEPTRLL